MGLAGRKEKQRIGPDPRNLTWAQGQSILSKRISADSIFFLSLPVLTWLSAILLVHTPVHRIYDNTITHALCWYIDNSRFGQQYLAKFGWTPDSGSGLGANGDGRLSHIPIAQKLNLLGIGSGPGAGASSPDAIAWKQSRDFEAVLKRLNGVEPEQEARFEKALLYGFVRGETTEGTMGNDTSGPEVALDEKAERRKEKKEETRRRKHERAGGGREIVQDALQAPLSPRLTIQSSSSGVTPVSQPKTDGMGPRMAYVVMILRPLFYGLTCVLCSPVDTARNSGLQSSWLRCLQQPFLRYWESLPRAR